MGKSFPARTVLLGGTTLGSHNVTSETSFELYRSQLAYARVDGRYASSSADVRIVMGAAAYAHSAAKYRSNADNTDALTSLRSVRPAA